MSDNEWAFQLSVKLGQDRSALLNVRAKDIAEFAEALRNLTSNAPEIAAASALFDPPKKAAPPAGIDLVNVAVPPVNSASDDWPAAHPDLTAVQRPAQIPTNQLGTEIGPFVLRAEAKAFIAKTGKNAGKASTRYVASLPGGIVASTFDELYGSILLQLNGKNAYARVDKNDRGYYQLVSVRPAP
jgi:hypothetical protein